MECDDAMSEVTEDDEVTARRAGAPVNNAPVADADVSVEEEAPTQQRHLLPTSEAVRPLTVLTVQSVLRPTQSMAVPRSTEPTPRVRAMLRSTPRLLAMPRSLQSTPRLLARVRSVPRSSQTLPRRRRSCRRVAPATTKVLTKLELQVPPLPCRSDGPRPLRPNAAFHCVKVGRPAPAGRLGSYLCGQR